MSVISRYTIRDAEEAIRRRLIADDFRGELKYEAQKIIENERWWYVPFCWIGCSGFIVNKEDLYVNWLGSALNLDQCFWGHEFGIFCDLVDFTFSPDANAELVTQLLRKFKHTHADTSGSFPAEPVWYRESELRAAFSNQFPLFKRHFVWFAIPELFDAYENHSLRFTCRLSIKP